MTTGNHENEPQERNAAISEASRREFEKLYSRITSDRSANAMRNMINVTSEDLAKNFKSLP